MIRNWFTTRELAELALPELPGTQQGMKKLAKKEDWSSRPRTALGGGLEYHIESLPSVARGALIEKLIGADVLQSMKDKAVYYAVPADAGTPKKQAADKEQRGTEKITIVDLFYKFCERSCMGVHKAEEPFLSFYQAERAKAAYDYIPAWVFESVPEFSISSLRRWRDARRSDLQSLRNGRYGNRKGSGLIERAEGGSFKMFILAAMLERPHMTAGHLRDLCRSKFGETVIVTQGGVPQEYALPHIRTFDRFIESWKKKNPDIYLRLTNPDAHKSRYMIAVGKADAGIDRLNQLWEIDASPADVLCKDGRYTIYSMVDVWSRRTLYLVTKTAKTEAALLLVRRAITAWGVPETLRTDNGSDFTSARFRKALQELDIEHDICPPFSGDKKAFVERSFRTLQHDLMPILPGYIGHSVKDRKAIESRRAFAQRLGVDAEKAFTVELEHAALQHVIDEWTNNRYMHRPHRGIGGQTPFTRMQSWTSAIRFIKNERALDVLLSPLAGGRTVGKKGIQIDNGFYMAGELIPFMGRRVEVRHNPEDMGRVYVFDEDNKFICEALCNSREGINPVAAAAEMKAQQKAFHKEKIAPLEKEMRRITPSYVADAILGVHAKDNAAITALPHKRAEYETDGLHQAARAAAAPIERAGMDLGRAMDAYRKNFGTKAEQNIPDEDRWYARARALELRLDSADALSEDDLQWLSTAQASWWYKAKKSDERNKAAFAAGSNNKMYDGFTE